MLDMLTTDSVSVKKEYEQEINGEVQTAGDPWRRAYINSVQGRQQVQDELPEVYKNAIFAVWGDKPTVTDNPEI